MKSNAMKRWNLLAIILCSAVLAAPAALHAQNPNCTIVIPKNPLTAKGLSTPYYLKASDGNGACDETNSGSSAFVQAAIFDPATGQISIYNPLVINDGTNPAQAPITPVLPAHAIIALWFGFNGDNLTQEGADPNVLSANNCVNGVSSGVFGQYSYCNAPAFFKAANAAIRTGRLRVPRLGTAKDGLSCPTVRDFYVVDQDQSDNLPVTYLIDSNNHLAQNTALNQKNLSNPKVLGNPSDNGLLDRFLDPAIGCRPWMGNDLADPGAQVPALALNELQARYRQGSPVARIPAGDPMVLDGDGSKNLDKVNAYRAGVDQHPVNNLTDADTARYCRNMLRMGPARLLLDQKYLVNVNSPVAGANSLFTFLAQRFTASYDILGCADLVHLDDPITVTLDDQQNAVQASINLPRWNRCKASLKLYQNADNVVDTQPSTSAP